MGFLDFTRKVFGDNDHNRLSWQIAKEVYGRDIADELRNLGGTPTALMTDHETKAYNVLAAIYNLETFELKTIPPRMTNEREIQLEKRKVMKEEARGILECDNSEKWSKRLDEYRYGKRVFEQLPQQQQEHDVGALVDAEQSVGETKYDTLSGVIFDICLEFTNKIGKIISSQTGADRYSENVILAATTFGTTLYNYSAKATCDRLSRLYSNQQEYKVEYASLLSCFAKRIQISEESFIETIEHLDKQYTLELLEEIADKTNQSLEEYLNSIERAIDDLLGKESKKIQSLSYRQEVMKIIDQLHNDFLRNPWENNPFVVLTRSVCGEEMAKELQQLDNMEGHGSVLQICTKEEIDAVGLIVEAASGSTSLNKPELEKAYELIYNHEKDFWKERLTLKKAGLSDAYYRANESEEDNKKSWRDYERIYGKTISTKLHAISKHCPSWLAQKIMEDEGMSWTDVQKQKPTFWKLAFEKYSDELVKIMEKCKDCC